MALWTRYGKRGLLEFLHYSGDMTVRMSQVTAKPQAGLDWFIYCDKSCHTDKKFSIYFIIIYVIVRRLYTECLEDSKQLMKAVIGVFLFLFFQPFDLVLRKKIDREN